MKISLTIRDYTKTVQTTIPGWPAESCEVPGLAVCYVPENSPIAGGGYQSGDGIWYQPEKYESRYLYQIIHINSGIAVISGLLNCIVAFALANRLSAIDWTVSEKEIRDNFDAYKRVVELAWAKLF